ncbi:hypothetical protein FXB40_37710 [Bradyrhizobium rifense]|uniref:Uncharacterized protein n=1 Tax=Bradyrhizobium rifense TaxID=515499 RepID=A0A5D3K2S7_9BRAD|nr:hypothetical protein [Bradyrhizobium rifense]TYL88733.1 hypothetical protein FXB40_37710 [Bradyrhizobium rifense]
MSNWSSYLKIGDGRKASLTAKQPDACAQYSVRADTVRFCNTRPDHSFRLHVVLRDRAVDEAKRSEHIAAALDAARDPKSGDISLQARFAANPTIDLARQLRDVSAEPSGAILTILPQKEAQDLALDYMAHFLRKLIFQVTT